MKLNRLELTLNLQIKIPDKDSAQQIRCRSFPSLGGFFKNQEANREIPIIDSGPSAVYINFGYFHSYLTVRKVGMKMVSTNSIYPSFI